MSQRISGDIPAGTCGNGRFTFYAIQLTQRQPSTLDAGNDVEIVTLGAFRGRSHAPTLPNWTVNGE